MKRQFQIRMSLIALLAGLLAPATATADEEIPPPTGKGRAVVVASGQSGPAHYHEVASRIAALGYDVLLVDGNDLEGTHGQALRDAIAKAQQLPHAMPGKVGLVGFSLGGGMVLGYGSGWNDQVAVVVAWYPATVFIKDSTAFAGKLNVPVLMFAGDKDTYKNCCLIGKAHEVADAAKAVNAQFTLTTYPGIEHDFVIGGSHYDAHAFDDAFAQTQAALKQYLGN